MKPSSVLFAGLVVCVCALGAPIAAASSATFDLSSDQWFIADVNPSLHIGSDPATSGLAWDGANGLPPGSVRVPDTFGWTWIGAPSSWLGDRSDAYGQSITVDLLVRTSDGVPYPLFALRGASLTLYVSSSEPVVGAWTQISVPIAPGAWRVNDYAASGAATEAQIREVLTDLRGFYIDTEWNTGPDDTSVDNIVFPGTPAPACAGDINGDGFTNAADFVILAGNFGASVPANTGGDLNGDGTVNASDFVILAGDFGCGN